MEEYCTLCDSDDIEFEGCQYFCNSCGHQWVSGEEDLIREEEFIFLDPFDLEIF